MGLNVVCIATLGNCAEIAGALDNILFVASATNRPENNFRIRGDPFGNVTLPECGGLLWLLTNIFVLVYQNPKLRATIGSKYKIFCTEIRRVDSTVHPIGKVPRTSSLCRGRFVGGSESPWNNNGAMQADGRVGTASRAGPPPACSKPRRDSNASRATTKPQRWLEN